MSCFNYAIFVHCRGQPKNVISKSKKRLDNNDTRTRFYYYIRVTFYTFRILFLIFGVFLLVWLTDESSVLNLFPAENKAKLFDNIPLHNWCMQRHTESDLNYVISYMVDR